MISYRLIVTAQIREEEANYVTYIATENIQVEIRDIFWNVKRILEIDDLNESHPDLAYPLWKIQERISMTNRLLSALKHEYTLPQLENYFYYFTRNFNKERDVPFLEELFEIGEEFIYFSPLNQHVIEGPVTNRIKKIYTSQDFLDLINRIEDLCRKENEARNNPHISLYDRIYNGHNQQ